MVINIILEIFLVLLGLYLAFFKSYFQEKGKNIATSEDIEQLTLKVESVKQQFLEKNANLKAKLELLTNLQISHNNDKRVALIDFHKKFKGWIAVLTEASPTLVNGYDNSEIQLKLHFYEVTYGEVLAAEALLELYIDDINFLKLVSELKLKVLENLENHPKKYLVDLKYSNSLIKQLDDETNIERRRNRREELLNKRRAIYDEYREQMLAGYKSIIEIEKEYRNSLRDLIHKIPTD